MIKSIIKLAALLPLSACVGSFVTGQSELVDGDFPDITEVPSRKEITKDRGYHGISEYRARADDMETLEDERIHALEEAKLLREKYLSHDGAQAQ